MEDKPVKLVTVTFRMDKDLADSLSRWCSENSISRSTFIRDAISDHLTSKTRQILDLRRGIDKKTIDTICKIISDNLLKEAKSYDALKDKLDSVDYRSRGRPSEKM